MPDPRNPIHDRRYEAGLFAATYWFQNGNAVQSYSPRLARPRRDYLGETPRKTPTPKRVASEERGYNGPLVLKAEQPSQPSGYRSNLRRWVLAASSQDLFNHSGLCGIVDQKRDRPGGINQRIGERNAVL